MDKRNDSIILCIERIKMIIISKYKIHGPLYHIAMLRSLTNQFPERIVFYQFETFTHLRIKQKMCPKISHEIMKMCLLSTDEPFEANVFISVR